MSMCMHVHAYICSLLPYFFLRKSNTIFNHLAMNLFESQPSKKNIYWRQNYTIFSKLMNLSRVHHASTGVCELWWRGPFWHVSLHRKGGPGCYFIKETGDTSGWALTQKYCKWLWCSCSLAPVRTYLLPGKPWIGWTTDRYFCLGCQTFFFFFWYNSQLSLTASEAVY